MISVLVYRIFEISALSTFQSKTATDVVSPLSVPRQLVLSPKEEAIINDPRF
jgi:hypothetical protein